MDSTFRSQPNKVSLSGDAPNPLRPYYIPPSVGLSSTSTAHGSTTNHVNTPSTSSALPRASSAPLSRSAPPGTATSPSFGTSARNILSDFGYGESLSSSSPTASSLSSSASSAAEGAKRLADQAIWRYTSVFLAQPFDVAKTVLQCLEPESVIGSGRSGKRTSKGGHARVENERRKVSRSGDYRDGRSLYGYASDEDSDLDSPSYFTSTAPSQTSYSVRSPDRSRHKHQNEALSTDGSPPYPQPRPSDQPIYQLDLHQLNSITEVLSQLWSNEGVWGLWKGTNATFIYGILFRTIETWASGLLAALLNLPDPTLSSGMNASGGVNVMESSSPMSSLAIVVAASGVAGVLLAPLDIVRTRLMLTPLTHSPRSIIPSLRTASSYTCPVRIAPITLLYNTLPALFSASTPLVLRSTFRIDPVLTPTTYSVATFISSVAELFIRLPCETVLRRAQIDVASESHATIAWKEQQRPSKRSYRGGDSGYHSVSEQSLPTVVEVGPYKGTLGTMWHVMHQDTRGLQDKTGVEHDERYDTFAQQQQQQQQQQQNQQVSSQAKRKKSKKGDGSSAGLHFAGLWRGWRVGVWGLVGVWGAAAVGGVGAGGEF